MNLKVVQWNIKNLLKHKSSLSLLCSNINPQVICLQETWSRSNSNLKIPGYNVISHKPRDAIKGGGVAILASSSLPITHVPITSSLEVCASRVHSSHISFTIISLYLPPTLNNSNLSNDLNALLTSLPAPYLICTDGNGHHESWGSPTANKRGKILDNWINSNNLILLNSGSPTYETAHGSFTHIDLTISSQNLALDYGWEVYHDNITSDHFPIIIKSLNHHIDIPSYSPKYCLQKANWQKFQDNLSIPLPPYKSPTEVCNLLEKTFISAGNSAIPLSMNKIYHKTGKFWWNSECKEALKSKKTSF